MERYRPRPIIQTKTEKPKEKLKVVCLMICPKCGEPVIDDGRIHICGELTRRLAKAEIALRAAGQYGKGAGSYALDPSYLSILNMKDLITESKQKWKGKIFKLDYQLKDQKEKKIFNEFDKITQEIADEAKEKKEEQTNLEQLKLETKEGFILNEEEAIERAYAEKPLREVALTPGLDPEIKKKIIEKAEQAGELAGKEWRETNKERLLKEYKESINQGPPDPLLAQQMALAEAPYREAAQIEGIPPKQKDLIIAQGEIAANKVLEKNLIKRIKELEKSNPSLASELEIWAIIKGKKIKK